MKSAKIREAFLKYFEEQKHTLVPSSSLVPENDPTLLFTNAGMVQFKETFLGLEPRDYVRAASSQRCVRAGGKHNDLENVGYTARHHTFFEMLGNFSFGDYFKREAIQFAWEFLTEVLKLPEEKLWVTVFESDDEAADIWLNEMKVSPERFSRCGEADNFWSMGDTGPCGPCSEIFYDHGPEVAGGPPGSPEQEGDRYVEIWNLVFMQYDRSKSGELTQLPKPSVDTGMGLERIAAVVQGVHSNYDIDLFQHLITACAALVGTDDLQQTSLKVIADHIRSSTFLIVDGVMPSNEGRGYVLRRIIRRAIRHGNKLGLKDRFFYKLVQPLVEEMGAAYPELKTTQALVEKVLLQEEEQFARTLDQGLKILEADIAALQDATIPGETVFKLYDTYGFPVDLTGDIARERGLELDMHGFEMAMSKQREQSQAASQFGADFAEKIALTEETAFSGYDRLAHPSKIVKIICNGEAVEKVAAPNEASIVLQQTPFYAESGGQVGDCGKLTGSGSEFVVLDTQKQRKAFLHTGKVTAGELRVGDEIDAQVDIVKRRATMLNHTATHLLHSALRQVLGEHVIQKGSLVEPKRLRFDFTHFEPISAAQLRAIEQLVNQKIRDNDEVVTEIMPPDDALEQGALGLFGDKYGDEVRVLSMGEFSKELCGGTHAKRTGDIGLFKITTESSIASGIRRIEAITGEYAWQWLANFEAEQQEMAELLKTQPQSVLNKVQQTLEKVREQDKRIQALQDKLASSAGSDILSQVRDIGGVNVLAAKLVDVDVKALRSTLDQIKSKTAPCVVVLAGVNGERVNVVAGLSKEVVGKVPPAKDYVTLICGKGGGRDDMAQGGGALPEDIDSLLQNIYDLVSDSTGR